MIFIIQLCCRFNIIKGFVQLTGCKINFGPCVKNSVVGNFLLGSLFTLLLVSEFAFKENELRGVNKPNQWSMPALPDQISFANEKVPVDRWDVKEKFDKEFLQIYYSPGAILYLVKLANRNFPVISERLKANGVPDDFKYLCIAESNMQSWAVSSSGAVGY